MSVVAEIKCIVLTGWLFTRDNKTGYKTSHVALWYGTEDGNKNDRGCDFLFGSSKMLLL